MIKNYSFDGSMTREVLENYLSRAVTAAGLYESDTPEDDVRALQNIGAKFLGRASGIWYMTEEDGEHFDRSKRLAEKIHRMDPEIILQACVFEWVTERMESVPVPPWVFQAFGLTPEDRCFCLSEALFAEEPEGFVCRRKEPEKSGGIPDLNRLEAGMWFYYRAVRYIDCGYEALHLGQVHLYTANDRGMEKTEALFAMIREYARVHARRHKVLMDAHTHGISRRGHLLFDYHAMPFTRVPLLNREGTALVLVREGFSEGGINPEGWEAPSMPYLMEYDNWGGLVVKDLKGYSREELAWKDWWGYDQIAWFAHQNEEERNHFLEYTYRWLEVNNPNGYFAFPFRRMLGDGYVTMERGDNGAPDRQLFYQMNRKGRDCPMGFSQEDTVKRLWGEEHTLRAAAANPELLAVYGAREMYDEETGLKLPERVVVYGSFQPLVGAVKHDSNSEVTRMYYVGGGMYALTVLIPYAGTYNFAISTYGTLSATYCGDGYPRSGSLNKGSFTVKKDNAAIRFTYRFPDNRVTVKDKY